MHILFAKSNILTILNQIYEIKYKKEWLEEKGRFIQHKIDKRIFLLLVPIILYSNIKGMPGLPIIKYFFGRRSSRFF